MTRGASLVCGVLFALTTAAAADGADKVAKPAASTTATTQPEPNLVATKRRIVGILDVRVQGVHKEIAAQFQVDLEKQLDSRSYWLATRTRLLEMLSHSTRWTDGCLVGSCLTEVRTQTGAEIVLIAAITGSDTSFGHVVTLMRTDTGRVMSQDTSRCDVCTVKEALSSATQAAVKLLTALPDTLPAETPPAPAPITSDATEVTAARATVQRKYRRIGIATTLVGLAVAGTGAALYMVKDRPSYALATAAGGGGLLLGGVIAISF